MKQLMRGLSESRTPMGHCVLRVHYSCDPSRDPDVHPEWKETERRKYTSQGAWDREQEIVFSAGGGERIFSEILAKWGHKIFIDPVKSGFQVDPDWKIISGFDWGKANPTAALVAVVDFEGTIYVMREYYQSGLSPKQHVPNLLQLNGFIGSTAFADPTIFYKTQAQADGTFKAIAGMLGEDGITNLTPAPERNELLGMERILAHWMNLDESEPSLKIICPERLQDIAKPDYGIHNEGCPNLIWELRRTRRAELSGTQLQTQNPTEKIVDKDNHLRDALKYLALSLPEPTRKSKERRVNEAMKPFLQQGDLTNAHIQRMKIEKKIEQEDNELLPIGGNIRQRLQRFQRNRY